MLSYFSKEIIWYFACTTFLIFVVCILIYCVLSAFSCDRACLFFCIFFKYIFCGTSHLKLFFRPLGYFQRDSTLNRLYKKTFLLLGIRKLVVRILHSFKNDHPGFPVFGVEYISLWMFMDLFGHWHELYGQQHWPSTVKTHICPHPQEKGDHSDESHGGITKTPHHQSNGLNIYVNIWSSQTSVCWLLHSFQQTTASSWGCTSSSFHLDEQLILWILDFVTYRSQRTVQ